MRTLLAVATYAVAGFLTYGHVFNANYIEQSADCGPRPSIHEPWEAFSAWLDCKYPPFNTTAFGAFGPAFLAGAAWPVYWAGKGAIHATSR